MGHHINSIRDLLAKLVRFGGGEIRQSLLHTSGEDPLRMQSECLPARCDT